MTATEEQKQMQAESAKVVKRFFKVIYMLIDQGYLRGKQTFTREYNINRWNFNSLEKDKERGIFQVAWLTYLVKDYGVSAEWLLTGRGKVFKA